MIRIITKTTVLVIIILLLNFTSKAQYYVPIPITGFNSDLVANGSNTVVLSTSNGLEADDSTGSDFYQQGYLSGSYGLPANGIINSISTPGIVYHLADYGGLNAILMTYLNQSQTLTLLQPGVFDSISICAASAGTIGVPTPLTAILNFSDGSNTPYSFSVPDWFDVGTYAIKGVDRVFRNGTFQNSNTSPNLFDCFIALNPTDKAKLLKSITFIKTGATDRTAIFAVCGITPFGTLPAPITTSATNITTNSFDANWDTVVGATNYKIDVSTDSTFSTFVSFYNNLDRGNIISCLISGITSSTTYYYRIRAENASGQGPNSNVTTLKTANVAPSNLTYSPNPVVATINTTDISSEPNISVNIDNYSISPALPDGVTLDSTTGVFSGKPTVLLPLTNFTITATNSGGSTTCTFTLTVIDIPPAGLSYSPNNVVATKGSTNISSTITNTGGAAVNFSINPPLPSGVILDTTSGLISGIPTVLSTITIYKIKATNTGGSDSCTFTLTVIDSMPTNLTYSPNNYVATIDTAINQIVPTNSGGSVTRYSISPAFPPGILFDTIYGIISGTPTGLSPSTNYLIKAFNTGGSDSCIFTLKVVDNPPTSMHYFPDTVLVATINSQNISESPSVTGGAVVNFSISPPLSVGLAFDTTSGKITGIPDSLLPITTYTITATNTGGSVTCTFTLTVVAIPPANLLYVPSMLQTTIDSTVSAFPSVDGIIVSYSISPALPSGIIFDTVTGNISGTTTVISPSTDYKIVATNSGGSDTCTFTLLVAPHAPVADSIQSFCGNATIANLVATVPSGLIVLWFNNPNGDTLLNSSTPLVSGNYYYAEAMSVSNSIPSLTLTPVLFNAYPNPDKPILVAQSSANNVSKLCSGDDIICSNFNNSFSYQWKLNDSNIVGQTNNIYIVPSTGAGNYSLYITNDTTGCNNISDILTVDLYPVATPIIDEKKEANYISILIVDNRQNLFNNYYWTYADSSALPSNLVNNRQFLVLPPSNMNAIYKVNIIDTNGCKASSAAKTVTLTKSLLARVCPTVNDGSFKLLLTDAQEGNMYVKIFNQNGIELLTYTFENENPESEYQINASELKSGLYNIEITLGDAKQTQKMIIQKH